MRNWINVPRNSTTSFEVSGIYAGRYLVRVRAINAAEISSGWAYSEEKTLTGKVGEPLPPLALTTASLTAGIEIRWEFPEGRRIPSALSCSTALIRTVKARCR
jgi:predicted phage tail protein